MAKKDFAKQLVVSMEELDQEMSELARDNRLHMDDDRDEIIQRYIEDLVDNADWKDHGEQDFDPADMEMEEELDRMRELAGIETDESLMADPEFKYNKNMPKSQNFANWKKMNDDEYRRSNEPYPDEKDQRAEFERQYGPIGDEKVSSSPDKQSASAFRKLMKAGQPRSVIDK